METPRDFCEPNLNFGWGDNVEVIGSLSSVAFFVAAWAGFTRSSRHVLSTLLLLCFTCFVIGVGSLLYHANVSSHLFMLFDTVPMLAFVCIGLCLAVKPVPKPCVRIFTYVAALAGFVAVFYHLIVERNGVVFDVVFGIYAVLIVASFAAALCMLEAMEPCHRDFINTLTFIGIIVMLVGLVAWQVAEHIVCPRIPESSTAVRYVTGGFLHFIWHLCVAYVAYLVILGCDLLSYYWTTTNVNLLAEHSDWDCWNLFPLLRVSDNQAEIDSHPINTETAGLLVI